MTMRTRRAPLVTLASAIVLLGGCASTGSREGEQLGAVPPPAPPAQSAERAPAEKVAHEVESKAKRTEKAEGTQDLVKDRVQVRTGGDGKAVVEQTGEASWYGQRHHGKKTASGGRFDQHGSTAAHPALPLGTKATVTNLETGKSTDVTITDRGPYTKGRDIDVSKAVAEKIGAGKAGTAPVKIEARVSPTPAR